MNGVWYVSITANCRPVSPPTPFSSHRVRIMAVQVSESDQIKQFKEFLGTYNKVTENCFMDCVRDFTTRDVKPEEPFVFQSSCSESCLQKYLKMTQRISMRFQEYHIQQNEALAAKAGLLGQPR
uniref:Mitochondrial import inner membrane translocase subunit n=1 Tax=Haplochromis burtoni TaxID=8153 RepID=A0A3Q2WP66_HAPBU